MRLNVFMNSRMADYHKGHYIGWVESDDHAAITDRTLKSAVDTIVRDYPAVTGVEIFVGNKLWFVEVANA